MSTVTIKSSRISQENNQQPGKKNTVKGKRKLHLKNYKHNEPFSQDRAGWKLIQANGKKTEKMRTTRQLSNRHSAALSLTHTHTHTSGITCACINRTHTDKHTAAFSLAWPHPAGSQVMMSSEPDWPCGEEEEDEEERGDSDGRKRSWENKEKETKEKTFGGKNILNKVSVPRKTAKSIIHYFVYMMN